MSMRSTVRRARSRSSRTSRPRPATGWWRSARPRSPTTGRTAGGTSTSRSRSATGESSSCPRGRVTSPSAADPGTPGREAEEVAGIDVRIDPGQAFGTGAHATTKLCLELLLELADAGEAAGPLVDLGTGSGVLGDLRRKARLGARRGGRQRAGVDRGSRRERGRQWRRARARAPQPARAAAADRAGRGREPDRAAARGGRRALRRPAGDPGLLGPAVDRDRAGRAPRSAPPASTVESQRSEGDWAALLARAE